jgi:hypothetical protein
LRRFRIWLQHREWEPAGDVEPESKADAAGTIRADGEWIGYREPDDQQQFVHRQHKDSVFVRNRYCGGDDSAADFQRHHVEFWQRRGELLWSAVVDAFVIGHGGGDSEFGVCLGYGLLSCWSQPASDIEPGAITDAAGPVCADREQIGYRKPDDQQQLSKRRSNIGVFERNRYGRESSVDG